MSNGSNASEALSALNALAHEQRLAVFRLLVKAGTEGMTAGSIAEAMQSPASSMSFHLAQLHRSGLIVQRRESRQLIYTAAYERVADLIAFLLEDCCGGRAEVCLPLAEIASRAACCDVKGQA
jgi:ArsR family transcriptional regulator